MCSAKYLSGFSSVMDWRPIEFMDLPPVRCCSLCNVVPKEIFLLECPHVLCSHCYQAVLQGNQCCPLDGESVQESEVQICTIKPSHLYKWKMRCCNSSKGCDFVGNVEKLEIHFLSDCVFHVVRCNRCNALVQRRDILSHYTEQRCQAASSSCDGIQISVDTGVLDVGRKIDASLEAIAERMCAIEIQLNNHAAAGIDGAKQCTNANKQLLNELEPVEGIHGESRNEAANMMTREEVSLNSIKERVEHIASNVQRNQGIVRIATDQIIEKLGAMGRHLEALEHIGKVGINEALFYIPGITELVERWKGVKSEWLHLERFSDVSTVCGYSVRVGMITSGNTFSLCLEICPSAHDDLLKWPFRIAHRYTLLHPEIMSKNVGSHFTTTNQFWITRPKNDPVMVPSAFALKGYTLEYIIRDGFVDEDSICVQVEFKPEM
ncbi:uncharacterized protein LOC135393261 [Ornithodoros turicata]|uniref:uncharacterized protein LOC135393261 n=1 Tax=Ornithodoros turicata TaxID=34597 RepID=UPI00313A2FA8